MKQPARAQLGRRYAGRPIGYRVLTLARVEAAPFTRAGVVEAQPGHYVTAVEAPPAGGWIVWGTAGADLIEAELLPAPPVPPDLAPLAEAIDALPAQLAAVVPTPAPVDLAPLTQAIGRLRGEVVAAEEAQRARRADDAASLGNAIGELREQVAALQGLAQTAAGIAQLTAASGRFVELTEAAARLIAANAGIAELGATVERLAQLSEEMAHAHREILIEAHGVQQAGVQRSATLALVEEFLAALEGGTRPLAGRFH